MKTVREYLEMMDEPERSQAIENAENDVPCTIESEADSTQDALLKAFTFSKTPKSQGVIYWFSIVEKYI